jgi:hypothetical protein
VEGELPFDGPELDQCPVTAGVAIGAGAPGYRQRLRGWTWRGGELGGDVAAWHREYRAAVVQELRGERDDHAGDDIVADMLALGEELVMLDDLVAKRERGVRVADVVRLNQRKRAEHHVEDKRLRLGWAGSGRLGGGGKIRSVKDGGKRFITLDALRDYVRQLEDQADKVA